MLNELKVVPGAGKEGSLAQLEVERERISKAMHDRIKELLDHPELLPDELRSWPRGRLRDLVQTIAGEVGYYARHPDKDDRKPPF